MTCSKFYLNLLFIVTTICLGSCSNSGKSEPNAPLIHTVNVPITETVVQDTSIVFIIGEPDTTNFDTQKIHIAISKDSPQGVRNIYSKAFKIALMQYVEQHNLSSGRNKVLIEEPIIERCIANNYAMSIPLDSIINAASEGRLEAFTSGAIPNGFRIDENENPELDLKIQALKQAISEYADTTLSATILSHGIQVKVARDTPFTTVNNLFETLRAYGISRFTLMTALERE